MVYLVGLRHTQLLCGPRSVVPTGQTTELNSMGLPDMICLSQRVAGAEAAALALNSPEKGIEVHHDVRIASPEAALKTVWVLCSARVLPKKGRKELLLPKEDLEEEALAEKIPQKGPEAAREVEALEEEVLVVEGLQAEALEEEPLEAAVPEEELLRA